MGNLGRAVDLLQRTWAHPDFGQRISDGMVREREPLPTALSLAVLLRDDYTCQECGVARRDESIMQVDHLLPVAAGGSDHSSNLRTLCRPCNQAKSNRFTIDVRAARPRVIVAYCLRDRELDEEPLFVDRNVFCAYCCAARSVHAGHVRQYELSFYLQREPGFVHRAELQRIYRDRWR